MQVTIGDLEDDLVTQVVEIAFDDGITFYDSSYLALAQQYETKLISADEELIRKVTRHKDLIMHLKEYPTFPQK